MFQPTPKRCFTIESLVAKDNPVPASRSEEPIRPAALSYANSGQMNPFLNGFHSGGRGVYSNPDLVFAEAVSHPPNSAVPVHPVAPPHALAAHPLSSSHSPHPLFGSQQRDPSTFYPWLLHRYRYLGHRFQGKSAHVLCRVMLFHLFISFSKHWAAQDLDFFLKTFSLFKKKTKLIKVDVYFFLYIFWNIGIIAIRSFYCNKIYIYIYFFSSGTKNSKRNFFLYCRNQASGFGCLEYLLVT